MGFCDLQWKRIERLRRSILEHPFNRELADSSLSPGRFRHYVIQDAHYLNAFSQVLALAAARAPDREAMTFLLGTAQESVEVERALHATFLRRFGLEGHEPLPGPSPSCLAYVSFLLALAYREPYPVLLAGLVPCFWIYWEVGREIARISRPGNPYQSWIDTYAGDEYAAVVRQMNELADRAAEKADEPARHRMREAFETASRLEWIFWDAAYRLEAWPEI